MATISTGVFKQLIAKKQAAQGTKATTGSAQQYRRVTSTLDLQKQTYQSNEIRPSMQKSDFRHGIRSVSGTISGEVSCGTYQGFIESMLRAVAAAAVTTGAQTNITAAVTSGASGTFTRAAGSFITDGFRVGMVIRNAGWAAPATANNAHNCLITALTATVMTGVMLDNVPFVAKAAGDSVTIAEAGKHIAIPAAAHTRDYWTIEHNFADIAQSEQFTDCVISQMNVKLPATGMATVDFNVMGLNMDTSTSAYFTAPSSASSGAVLAAVNGAVYIQGAKVGLITGMDFTVNGNMSTPGGIVGSNVDPDIFPGMIDVSGNMTVLFTDATMRDYFINETEVSIVAVFTSGNSANSDFQSHVFPRVKVGGATKDDGQKGLTMTMPFTALENTTGSTSTIATTYWTQDSLHV
jgi:hypothetical protein